MLQIKFCLNVNVICMETLMYNILIIANPWKFVIKIFFFEDEKTPMMLLCCTPKIKANVWTLFPTRGKTCNSYWNFAFEVCK